MVGTSHGDSLFMKTLHAYKKIDRGNFPGIWYKITTDVSFEQTSWFWRKGSSDRHVRYEMKSKENDSIQEANQLENSS